MMFRSYSATHPGAKRSYNEDACVDRPDLGLWAVADGAGGHQSGATASAMIRDALGTVPPGLPAGRALAEVRLRLEDTHNRLREEAASRGEGTMIASTVVVLLVRGEHYACLWAGDSRAYLLRNGRMVQVTKDHSLVQEMVDSGALTPEQAEGHPRANVITRAVGAGEDGLELDKITDRLHPGDRFLLCSDGLNKTLADAELAALLASPEGVAPPELLIHAALARQATDNITAVTVEVAA